MIKFNVGQWAHLTLDIEHPTLEIGHWIREIWRKRIYRENILNLRYRRHILQAIDLEKLLKHNHGPDQDLKNAKQARGEKPEKNENADFETGGNFSLGAGPRPTEGEQCSMIPPGLHGRFPVTLTDIPR